MIRVLFVDDEFDTERFQSKVDILSSEGIEVKGIQDVADVMPFLRQQHASVAAIVLDVLMPPLDTYSLEETNDGTATGLRLLEDIRAILPDVPVVIVSVKPKTEALEWIARFKVSAYLTKPVLATDIARAVKESISKRPGT